MLGALPPIFAGLPHESQQEAASYLAPVSVESGEAIMIQGEEDTTIAFVASGTCEIWRGEVKVGTAGQRELVGEVELFGQIPRVCSVTAASPVVLQALEPDAYVALAEAGNPIIFQLERAAVRRISERIGRLNESLVQYTRGAPVELHPRGGSFVDMLTAPFRRRKRAPDLDKAEVLARSDLFSWAPPHVLGELAEHFTVERFDAEHVLCEQGQDGDRMFLIASGAAEVMVLVGDDRAQSLATLGAGQAFGDTAMALSAPRSARVVSRDELVALTLDRGRFRDLYEANDGIGSTFRQGIVRNLITQLLPSMDRFAEALSGATPPDEGLYKGTPVNAMWRD